MKKIFGIFKDPLEKLIEANNQRPPTSIPDDGTDKILEVLDRIELLLVEIRNK